MRKTLTLSIVSIIALLPFLTWLTFYIKGKRFARRDRLQKADAIIVLAGTRGNITFLDGKIRTAVHLYHQGWAPYLIVSGKFSAKVTETNTVNLRVVTPQPPWEKVLGRRLKKSECVRGETTKPICTWSRFETGDTQLVKVGIASNPTPEHQKGTPWFSAKGDVRGALASLVRSGLALHA